MNVSEPTVIVTDSSGVRTIRINRPEAMNALNLETKVALREAVLTAAADLDVRCVVLTGTGRAFCVGQDLREHIESLTDTTHTGALASTVTDHFNPIALALATMPKPVIAAVNGVAAGAGMSLTLPADLRIVAESAGFNSAFTGVALSADTGASWWLPRLIGMGPAKDLLLRPRTVGAAEALTFGLASQVVPDDALAEHAQQLAAELAAGPTAALGAVRQAVLQAAGSGLDDALRHEAELMAATGATADHMIAVQAFLAKHKPVYTGR